MRGSHSEAGPRRSDSRSGVSLRSWWSWALEPWRSFGVAVALVGALSLPALLASAGPMFEQSASDEVAHRVVGGIEPGPAGIYISAVGSARAEVLDPFGDAVEHRLDRIDELAPSVRLLITEQLPVEVGGGASASSRAVTGRLFARPGAVDSLEVVSGSAARPGAWISETLAANLGVGPGVALSIAGGDPVPVAGVYRDLWAAEPDAYWDDVPSDFFPRFLRVFDRPNFELVLVDDAVVSELGPDVRAVWQAPLEDVPATWDGARALASEYRTLERDLRRDRDLTALHLAFAMNPEALPSFFTALFDAETDAGVIVSQLSQPISTATLAGIAAGLALSTLGAVFLIRRKRGEYRLLAADGDGRSRFFVRAVVQYLAPAAAGILIGVVVAWLTISLLGPSGSADIGAVPWTDVVALSIVACLLAGTVTALLAVRLVDGMNEEVGTVSSSWLFLLVGVTVAMWVQAGQTAPDDADALAIAFPFVGIVTGVVAMVVALRLLLRAVRRTGARLPTSLFLAWRAVTGSETGALLLTGALGLAAGLAVLSSVFVFSVDTAIADKAATIVGSNTRLDVTSGVDPSTLPEGTTILRTQSTRVDDAPVDVILIDPATFATSVIWPSSFGSSAADVVATLGDPLDGAVPAVIVGADRLPARGQIGLQRVYPYEVVDELRSFPLASAFRPTLVMRLDRFEDAARGQFERGMDEASPTDQLVADTLGEAIEFDSPVGSFGYAVLSRASPDDLVPVVTSSGVIVRETVTLAQESTRVDNQSFRWAFDYLRILAAIGAMTSLGAMALYLSERRSERAVAAVMVDQMGVPRRTNLTAAIAEMVGLVVVALVTGAVSALIVAARVFRAFEPNPRIPPTGEVVVPFIEVVTIVLVAVVAVAATAAWVQHAATSTVRSRVFRG